MSGLWDLEFTGDYFLEYGVKQGTVIECVMYQNEVMTGSVGLTWPVAGVSEGKQEA